MRVLYESLSPPILPIRGLHKEAKVSPFEIKNTLLDHIQTLQCCRIWAFVIFAWSKDCNDRPLLPYPTKTVTENSHRRHESRYQLRHNLSHKQGLSGAVYIRLIHRLG